MTGVQTVEMDIDDRLVFGAPQHTHIVQRSVRTAQNSLALLLVQDPTSFILVPVTTK